MLLSGEILNVNKDSTQYKQYLSRQMKTGEEGKTINGMCRYSARVKVQNYSKEGVFKLIIKNIFI